MSFIIDDLKPFIKEALEYGDLSNTDDCVKTPDDYKAAMFVGFNKGQVFCVVFKKQFESYIKKLFEASYEALQQVRGSYGSNKEAQDKLSIIESKIYHIIEMLPVFELGAFKTLSGGSDLPMLYNY